ncbi:MAG: adenosine deaminase family protein [Candidatus Sericytochromatia bacterium]|nr:adenosine deaminase family protein [Candidatus Sericytochromatia bacterium]
MTEEISLELLKSLPKTDLHVHLDGSLRLGTIINLADRYRIKLPANDIAGLSKALVVDDNCNSLVDYLRAFDVTLKVLQTDEALEMAAFELAEDAAQENVRYMEIRFAPILHTNNMMSLEQIINSVVEGLKRAEKIYNIKTGLIICGMRHFNSDVSLMSRRLQDRLSTYNEQELAELLALETAKVAVKMSKKEPKIMGFDLAGAENGYPAKDFYRAFQEIISGHLSITVHAGEAYGPDSMDQAVKYCHAHRIGHGTRLIESKVDDESVPTLYRYFKDKRIPLEVCVTSNIQTRTVNSIQDHPIKKFFEDRLRLTICTDNRLISNITVSDEYYKLVTQLGFKKQDIETLLIYGFESIFLPYEQRKNLLEEVIPEIQQLLYSK